MSKEAVFTLKLESELRNAFMAEAETVHRSASQLVREFMREFIEHQREHRLHESWFRGEGLQEATDPSIARIPHHTVQENLKKQRVEWMKRLDETR